MSRRATSLVMLAAFFSLATGLLLAQAPSLPTVARLQALKLDVVAGDVPAYYSQGVAREVVASLAQRLEACRSLYPEAGRPPIALAVLNASDWRQLTPAPYGMPHSGAEPPYVVVVPNTWRDVSPMLAGARDRYAKAVGDANVDPSVRLLAVHELGHVILSAVLGQKNWAPVASRFPFWYGEFAVNYFADTCNARQPEAAALARRWDAAGLALGRHKYTKLDDWDRLMSDVDAAGRPYLTTEEGGLNFAGYQALSSEMAHRLRDAGFTAPRLIQILRQQWARPGRQSTDDLLKDFTGAAPGFDEWLVQQGAVDASGKRSPRSGEVPLFSVKVTGQGQPMLLIPGLISSGDVWKSTVAHYRTTYECHVLTLAGFAGQPPSDANPFLPAVRDAIARYIREQKLQKPVIVGHSLGGFLALSVAAANPDLVGTLVIVDGLPAPGADEKPDITREELSAMSQRAAASYVKADSATRRKMIAMMARNPEHAAMIAAWDEASDRPTAVRAVAETVMGDVRAGLARVEAPALVLASLPPVGPSVDKAAVERIFRSEFKYMKNWQLELAPPAARHFIMFDEPEWMFEKMDKFLR